MTGVWIKLSLLWFFWVSFCVKLRWLWSLLVVFFLLLCYELCLTCLLVTTGKSKNTSELSGRKLLKKIQMNFIIKWLALNSRWVSNGSIGVLSFNIIHKVKTGEEVEGKSTGLYLASLQLVQALLTSILGKTAPSMQRTVVRVSVPDSELSSAWSSSKNGWLEVLNCPCTLRPGVLNGCCIKHLVAFVLTMNYVNNLVMVLI